MFDPSRIALDALPSVPLADRRGLPASQGIYFVLGSDGTVLYVGKSQNIGARWAAHHRLLDLAQWQSARVAWLQLDGDAVLLHEIERACIEHFSPVLNGSSVQYGPSDVVKRSFSFSRELYERLERVAAREWRTVNAQVVRWLTEKVDEYEAPD